GQTFSLSGDIYNLDGEPMIYSTVVLLNPIDSTMEFFAITNQDGHFEVKNIKQGDYLFQSAFLGYQTYYREVSIPVEGNNIGSIVMNLNPVGIDEVDVYGEHVPMWIKKDTVEFNADAFKTRPGDVAEDLLKKLPGIEVDRSGNIKAMGEDVQRLYVDGKEFFGNDPKVATKNVPANALDKVQVYDKRSDEAEFTGLDDGTRAKTINLKLKEDKKNAMFGDLMAGGGTNSHYQTGAKAYRFTDKVQIAALGMVNNINQAGFSFNDYLNFNGGLGSMVHGGGSMKIAITSDNSFPINFGSPVSGLMTSGAGGANFSYSTSPNDRVFVSYLGNGSNTDLEQTTTTRNYTKDDSFNRIDELEENKKNEAHRFNFGLRRRIDSTQNIIFNGNVALTYGNTESKMQTNSSQNNISVNELMHETFNDINRTSGNASGSYIKKINHGNTMFKIGGDGAWSKGASNTRFENRTKYFGTGLTVTDNQFQEDNTGRMNYSFNASMTQKLAKKLYIDPIFMMGSTVETLERSQGLSDMAVMEIDSLSPDFEKRYNWMRPTITIRRVSDKSTISLSLIAERGKLSNTLNQNPENENKYFYFTPKASVEVEYASGRRLTASYSSAVNTPSINQLLPVVNNINSLSLYYGNPNLKPEFTHRANMHWIIFDQFSFTSFFMAVNGSFTQDKINWSRTITDNLKFVNRLVNVDKDFETSASFDFSTPIRKLGVKINISGEESWNKGLNLINGADNEYITFSHRYSLSIDNRKKEKWDVISGVGVTLTNSKYSLQESLNDKYFDLSWFAELRYSPNDDWDFETTADITNYNAESFDKSISVPLLGAQVSHHFLNNNRGTLTLRGFDLLNKNTIVQRFGELNYLREVRSNSIGRYVMLSFTYRLNKFGGSKSGIDIKMKHR
ncbi:MAG: TonB-dependent receptor, partial [Mariniphaga sp.]|nr:TonB-dependent receptor [Mariniphaga sp.]